MLTQDRELAEGPDGGMEPELAALVAPLQIALGSHKQANDTKDALAEDLSQRISTLEIACKGKAEHADLIVAMQRQMDCLLRKKACPGFSLLSSLYMNNMSKITDGALDFLSGFGCF